MSQPPEHGPRNHSSRDATARPWRVAVSPAIRFFLVLIIVTLFARTPSDGLLLVDLLSDRPDPSPLVAAIAGRMLVIDFLLAFMLATIAAIAILWPMLWAEPSAKPPYGRIWMRAIDIGWYIGATTAALIAVAELQQGLGEPRLAAALERQTALSTQVAAAYEDALRICATPNPAIDEATASPDLKLAHHLIPNFCAEQRGGQDPFAATPLAKSCTGIASDSRHWPRRRARNRTPPFDEGLRAHEDIYQAVRDIRALCDLDRRRDENDTEILVFRTMAESGASITGAKHLFGYFRFVAVLLGFRVVRALSELMDEFRAARKSRPSG